MTEFLPSAYVVHWVPGRLRLRIPDKRRDLAYFAELGRVLTNRRQVVSAAVNPYTGSVLLRLSAGVAIAEVAARARELSLFALKTSPPPVKRTLISASVGFKSLDNLITRSSGGYLDVKTGVFTVLLALGVWQTIKGNFMVPGGFTLLWYALTMALD